MENEIWKDIEGYEGYYQISNMGRIKSVDRKIILRNGFVRRCKGREMKIFHDGGGYCFVMLSKDGECKPKKIHRLVAEAFIDNPEGLETVNHKDYNKDNNRVENLEWMTRKDNIYYGGQKGIMVGMMPNRFVRCVETGEVFCSVREAGRSVGVSHTQISRACRNEDKTAGGLHFQYYEVEEEDDEA